MHSLNRVPSKWLNRLITALGFLAGISEIVWAQNNVGPGEQRFNAAIYKASHNSYERDESLHAQIDDYNCWFLELDLRWRASSSEVRVAHTCLSGSEGLTFWLNDAAQAVTAHNRVTVIYLDMKAGYPCDDWPALATYRSAIKQNFIDAFGIATIYASGEFKTRDLSRWPSYQELVRRDYHWIVILDEHDLPGAGSDDDFFFGITEQNPPPADLAPNTVLVNIDGGWDSFPTSDSPATRNDRWLYRLYPSVPGCPLMDEEYWQNGIQKGYNFIATDCVNEVHTFQLPTHSPDPLFVDPASPSVFDLGTRAVPYHDLVGALNRASPMVTVLIAPGLYQLTGPGGSRTINQAVILKARDDGSVVIR